MTFSFAFTLASIVLFTVLSSIIVDLQSEEE
jgi:hypothetical protein